MRLLRTNSDDPEFFLMISLMSSKVLASGLLTRLGIMDRILTLGPVMA